MMLSPFCRAQRARGESQCESQCERQQPNEGGALFPDLAPRWHHEFLSLEDTRIHRVDFDMLMATRRAELNAGLQPSLRD